MKVHFFTTPNGEDMAIMGRADYDQLAALAAEADEDAADVALYDQRKAQSDMTLPPEVTALMLRGNSLLKAVRLWRDMTQTHVADFKFANLSQSYLSDLEAGHRKGTPETLTKLAKIYDVPKQWFL
jgi:hypothetical protein